MSDSESIINKVMKTKFLERICHLEEQLITHMSLVEVLQAQVQAQAKEIEGLKSAPKGRGKVN